jgi:hypothetical protein
VDLPLFHGDNAAAWLLECEGIFDLAGIDNEHKIKWANAHIHGKAKTWLSSANIQLYLMNWQQFCSLLCERFPGPSADDSMEQCQVLKQLNTVDNYIDQFEEWMSVMRKDHNYLTENFFLLRFLSGLKETIKHDTKCHKPATLRAAYWFARQQEQSFLANNKRTIPPTVGQNIPAYQQARAPLIRDNKPRLSLDKAREKGKCWYCPKPWSFGHKCTIVQSMLHAIQLQGHSSEEEEFNETETRESLDNLQQDKPAGMLMSISSAAAHGIAGNDTISLKMTIQGVTAITLVDSGSSSTFIDKAFAIKNDLSMRETVSRIVTVAGGGTLLSDAVISKCHYSIQRKKFIGDFKVLPLKGFVLGVSWLKQYNPTTFDWVARSVTITDQGKEYTFQDHLADSTNNIITATQCNSILHKATHGFLVQIFHISDKPSSDNIITNIPPKIQHLLAAFSDVFTAPSGLPPVRSCDHKIVLQEGANPPNIRPYRLPHKQKDIVESLIKEMLEHQEIRKSTSPYCSPAIIVSKKDKSWRLCNDFHQLNAITIKNKYPIPVIEDLLDELQGATIFSKLDLRLGYHQI